MKKIIVLSVIVGVACFLGFSAVAADKAASKPQTDCPVMGGKIDKTMYVDYKGMRVYFCCPGCPGEFSKDPEKYLKAMADAGVAPQKTKPQTMCPVMGDKIDKKFYADFEGKRVYFCCADCPAEFQKDPAKYVTKMEADGVAFAKVQTLCPITGKAIDKKFFADYEHKRVYFSDHDSIATFKKAPAKYVKQLEDAGIALDPAPKAEPKHQEGHDTKKDDHSGHMGH